MNPYNDTEPKKEQVRRMFDDIAPSYDRLNTLLSFGIHRRWRRIFVRTVMAEKPTAILDLATGTGDMAVAFARASPSTRIVGADISEGMLARAAEKIERAGLSERIELRECDAEALPFAEAEFDCVSIVFGVRNFQEKRKALDEIRRTLRSSGVLVVMEFSMPEGKIFGRLYRFYQKRCMPCVGRVLSRNGAAYAYLPDSIPEFAGGVDFLELLRECGFVEAAARRLTHGVSTVYTCKKP